jgi:hypothetical protein
VSREGEGELSRALVEADAIWSAVVAEERGLSGRGRAVAAVTVRAQRREMRRLRLWGMLPDHRHGGGSLGACAVGCDARGARREAWGVRREL